jgi:hypothetical protein
LVVRPKEVPLPTVRIPSAIEPIALIFKLNNVLVSRTLDGLSEDDVWSRHAGGNPISWILGHITESRANLLGHLGAPFETGWGPLFPQGGAVLERARAPSRASIEAGWQATHQAMRDAFAGLGDRRLSEASPVDLPGADSVAGLIGFYAFHESYHVGQLGYIRKRLGHSAVAG